MLRIWGKSKVTFIDKVLVLMGREGVSSSNAERSLREAMAVAVIHGRHPVAAIFDYGVNYLFNYVKFYLRKS